LNIYEAFETSQQLVDEGKWIEIEFDGSLLCSICVRSASPELNAKLRKAMTEEALASVAKSQSLETQLGDPDREVRLFAKAVVTDWKGITDREGKKLKCTPANVEKIFRELPLLANRVKREAYRWTNFRAALEAEVVGN